MPEPSMEAVLPLHEFLSGGYLLAKAFVPPPEEHPVFFLAGHERMPYLSAGECIGDLLPDGGDSSTCEITLEFYERAWGIAAARAEAFQDWKRRMTAAGRISWGDAFADPDVARECAREFVAAHAKIHLIGLGLHQDLWADYVDGVRMRAEHIDARGRRIASVPNGVYELVEMQMPLADGARHVGYEVLDVYPGESRHSWLCHGLIREWHLERGVELTDFNLIAHHDDARRIAAACNEEDAGCEPGLWMPWRIVEYVLER